MDVYRCILWMRGRTEGGGRGKKERYLINIYLLHMTYLILMHFELDFPADNKLKPEKSGMRFDQVLSECKGFDLIFEEIVVL